MFPMSDFTKFVLEIKDPNIIPDQNNFIEVQSINGLKAVVYHAVLSYSLKRCPHCGFVGQVVKNGTKTVRILLPTINRRISYLALKKQRFLCRNCQATSTAQTDLIKEHCHIAQSVHWSVNLEAQQNSSLKDLSARHGISASTVQRFLLQDNQHLLGYQCHQLPKHLLFDEVKAVNTYSFIMMDGQTSRLLEILPTRLTQELKSYFQRFSLAQRQQVKTVVVDLNAAYINFIPQLFPNAQIIIDRFHLVQMANRSVNTIRTKLMKKYPKTTREYKSLKFYWRLFLKDGRDLEAQKLHYQFPLRLFETQVNLVQSALNLDKGFRQAYETYQWLLSALKARDPELLERILKNYKKLGNEMDQTIASFKQHRSAILNSCRYAASNGPLEGLNGKIKQIKRTSYGFRNFENFRLRIFLECQS